MRCASDLPPDCRKLVDVGVYIIALGVVALGSLTKGPP